MCTFFWFPEALKVKNLSQIFSNQISQCRMKNRLTITRDKQSKWLHRLGVKSSVQRDRNSKTHKTKHSGALPRHHTSCTFIKNSRCRFAVQWASAHQLRLTKSSMASFIAEMLSTKTRGITVAMGFREDTAGINYDITNNEQYFNINGKLNIRLVRDKILFTDYKSFKCIYQRNRQGFCYVH